MSDLDQDFPPYLDGADLAAKLVDANNSVLLALESITAAMSRPIREELWASVATYYERVADQARQRQRRCLPAGDPSAPERTP